MRTTLAMRLRALLAVLAALAAVAGGVAVAAPAHAAPLALTVSVAATFTDEGGTTASSTGKVAGETTTTVDGAAVAGGGAGFTYTVTCKLPSSTTDCTSGGATVRTTWGLRPDGVPEPAVLGSGGLSTRRGWANAGVHPVTVTVDVSIPGNPNTYGTGTAAITTYASERYADVNAATAGAGPIWTATASGLMAACRPDLDTGAGQGQGDFCAAPSAANQPSAAKPPAAQLTVLRNTVTGASCLSSDAACNVTADAQAWNQGGNPLGVCDSSNANCFTKLQAANPSLVNVNAGISIPATGGIYYQPTLCADNAVEPVTANTSGSVTAATVQGFNLVRGVEAGCATYRDLVGGLVAATGSFTDPPANLPAAPVGTAVRNTVTNPTFAAASGWTTAGNATVVPGTSDGTPLSGGAANLGSGGSVTSARYPVTSGAPSTAVAVVRSTGATVTVTLSWYVSDVAATPVGTITRTFLVANNPGAGVTSNGSTLVVPAVVPYSATRATVTVTSTSGDASVLNVTAPTAPTASGAALTGVATPTYPIGSSGAGVLVACPAGPQPDDTVRRAVGLFGSSVTWCDTDRALTRRDAYTLVGVAAGWTPNDSAGAKTFRDLNNPTLAATTTADEATLRGWVGAAADHGVGAVGSTTCPNNGAGSCFLPDDAMSRAELAALLAAAATGPGSSFAYTPGAAPDGTTVGPTFGFAALFGAGRFAAGSVSRSW